MINFAVSFLLSFISLNVLIFASLPSTSRRFVFYFRSAVIPVLLELIRCHLLFILNNAENFFEKVFSLIQP